LDSIAIDGWSLFTAPYGKLEVEEGHGLEPGVDQNFLSNHWPLPFDEFYLHGGYCLGGGGYYLSHYQYSKVRLPCSRQLTVKTSKIWSDPKSKYLQRRIIVQNERLIIPAFTHTVTDMAKKDKKKGKQQDDYWDTEFQDDAAVVQTQNNEEPQTKEENGDNAVMDDLADDFGGLMSALKKVKGGKKGKKQDTPSMVDANEELEALNVSQSASANGAADENDGGEEGEFRVKTKKEKEKEKKEKEKAKKKAQV
jgi:hypothetical protein